jgi:hypothetical protein
MSYLRYLWLLAHNGVQHIMDFFLCTQMLPVSLDCTLLIAPSVFSFITSIVNKANFNKQNDHMLYNKYHSEIYLMNHNLVHMSRFCDNFHQVCSLSRYISVAIC